MAMRRSDELVHPYKVVERETTVRTFLTFTAAESYARGMIANGIIGPPLDIYHNTHGMIAAIKADAFGRIWTDLTGSDGGRLNL